MDHRNHKRAAWSFAEAFATSLSASVSQAAGFPWKLEVAEHSDPPARDVQPLPFRVKVEGRIGGEYFIEFYDTDLLARFARTAEGADERSAIDGRKLLLPVLNTAAAQLKTALAVEYGELAFQVDDVSELACGGMFVVPLRLQSDPRAPAPVFLYFDSRLLESLSPERQSAEVVDKRNFHPANLRLVMDVELNVSLRFGQRQLPLREVLELTSGSVIELDKMVDEPVEMLLDGKVVARGEAVIVDGNYGLRVTEIPQALEAHLLGM